MMDQIKTLGQILEEVAKKNKRKEALLFEGLSITYQELDETSNKVANALAGLGITAGDRVAIMLPNIPEFVYCFYGIQKLGAIAVPFNTMYKGREIVYILNNCAARAIITLTNFAPLINEVREDVPSLEHVILTGQRTLVFVTPESTVNVQMVMGADRFNPEDEAFRAVGKALIETLKTFGVEAWYKHRGGVRVGGKKIATVLVSKIENLLLVNVVIFLVKLDMEQFFRVIWVSPEIKDKVVEPITSVEDETGKRPDTGVFKDVLLKNLSAVLGVEFEAGQLKRDELFGYEKARALAKKT